MTDDERNRFESMDSLRQAAYNSFNDRRSYEWKFSLSIWTALAVLLAGLVQPAQDGASFPLKGAAVWLVAAIVGVLLVLLHAYWSNGASRANSVDKGVALYFACAMQDMLMLSLPFDGDLRKKIEALPKTEGWTQWSHLAQVAITALLSLAVVSVIYVRSS